MLDHCGIAGDALLPCYVNMYHILYPAVAIYGMCLLFSWPSA